MGCQGKEIKPALLQKEADASRFYGYWLLNEPHMSELWVGLVGWNWEPEFLAFLQISQPSMPYVKVDRPFAGGAWRIRQSFRDLSLQAQ